MMRVAVLTAYLGWWAAQGLDQCTCTSFASTLERGGSACQYGNNCASRNPDTDICPGRNGVPCCIDKSVTCDCPSYQNGAQHGDAMCEFQGGQNCRMMFDGERRCPAKARKCFLALPEYRDEVYCHDDEPARYTGAVGFAAGNMRGRAEAEAEPARYSGAVGFAAGNMRGRAEEEFIAARMEAMEAARHARGPRGGYHGRGGPNFGPRGHHHGRPHGHGHGPRGWDSSSEDSSSNFWENVEDTWNKLTGQGAGPAPAEEPVAPPLGRAEASERYVEASRARVSEMPLVETGPMGEQMFKAAMGTKTYCGADTKCNDGCYLSDWSWGYCDDQTFTYGGLMWRVCRQRKQKGCEAEDKGGFCDPATSLCNYPCMHNDGSTGYCSGDEITIGGETYLKCADEQQVCYQTKRVVGAEVSDAVFFGSVAAAGAAAVALAAVATLYVRKKSAAGVREPLIPEKMIA